MNRTVNRSDSLALAVRKRNVTPMRIKIWVKQVGDLAIGVFMGEFFLGRLEGDEFCGDYQLHGESETRTRLEAELRSGDAFHEAPIAYGSKLYRAIMEAAFGDGGNRKKID
jgi:hypothetical protein